MILAHGLFGTTQAAIYTVPTGKRCQIKRIIVTHNAAAATQQDVTLWLKPYGETARIIWRDNSFDEHDHFEVDSLEDIWLKPGDAVQAKTTTATLCDYVVLGVLLGSSNPV